MPAQWTGDLISKMHLHDISIKRLAEHENLHPKYVGMILNGKRTPPGAEERLIKAVDEIIAEKQQVE